MIDDDANPAPLSEEDRREFLRLAGRFAITAPATVLLLQAAATPAEASPYGGTTTSIGPA